MDIIVKSRHTDIDEDFRVIVRDKISRVAKLDSKVDRVDVEVAEEHNPRQSDVRMQGRADLSHPWAGRSAPRPPPPMQYAALDLALGKLDMRLRRAADRRRVHHGSRTRSRSRRQPARCRADGSSRRPPSGRRGRGRRSAAVRRPREACTTPRR